MTLRFLSASLFVMLLAFSTINFITVFSASINVQPSFFDPATPFSSRWVVEKLQPGESTTKRIKISATEISEATEIEVTTKDAIQTEEGTYSFKNREETNTGAGNWLSLSQTNVNFDKNGSQEIDLTIKVPENTNPGEYSAVVSIQEKLKNNESQTGVFSTTGRVGMRVYITVPGELEISSEVGEFAFLNPESKNYNKFISARQNQPNNHVFTDFTFSNNSNIYTKAVGKIEITGPNGKVEIPFNRDFAPNTKSYILNETPYKNPEFFLQPGDYKAVLIYQQSSVIPQNKDLNDAPVEKKYETTFSYTAENIQKIQNDLQTKTKQTEEKKAQTQTAQVDLTIESESTPESKSDFSIWFIFIAIFAVILFFVALYLFLKYKKVL